MPDEAVPRGTLGTVRNATLLLELLSHGSTWKGLTEVAEASGMSVPTTHRLLRSLVAAGLVEQHPRSSRYGLGRGLVRLSERYLGRHPALSAIGPYLTDLRNRTQSTLQAALLLGTDVAYVDRVDAPDVLDGVRRAARMLPAHRSPAGRLLLALAGPQAWKAISPRPGEHLPEHHDWEALAEMGHAVGDAAGLLGHREVAVAVPVGTTAPLALTATAATSRFDDDRFLPQLLGELQHTAELVARSVPDD